MIERIKQEFYSQLEQADDLYQFLNRFREWVNNTVVNYEIFLEDNWFEDKTTIEYTWRCLDTFNILVVAEDEYQNYIEKGTWHLGQYVKTYWVVDDPWEATASFFAQNTPPRLKNVADG